MVELGLLSTALDKRQSDAVDNRNMMSIEDTIAQINAADTEEGSNTLLDESADYTTAKTIGGRGAKWWRRGPAGWGGVGSLLHGAI